MRTILLMLAASFAVACTDGDSGTTGEVGGGTTNAGTGGGFGAPPGEPAVEGVSNKSVDGFENGDEFSCNAAPLIDVSLPYGFERAVAAGQYVDSMLKRSFLPDPSALRFEPLRAYLENRDASERLEAWVEPRGTDSVRLQVRLRSPLGAESPPDHVIVVLDVSSSMAQSASLRDQELNALALHLDQVQSRFSLITFAGEATVLIDKAPAGEVASSLAVVSTQLVPGEGHNLSAALKEAAALVDSKTTQLLVLTDAGFSADATALEQARALQEGGSPLSVVQLAAPTGFQRQESAAAQTALRFDMLTELAEAGGGLALFADGESFAPETWVPPFSMHPAVALILPGNLQPLDVFVGEVVGERRLPSTVTGTASTTLYTGCLDPNVPADLTIDGNAFSLKFVGDQWALQDSVRTKADEKLQAVVKALRTQTPPNDGMLPGDFVCEALAAFSSPVACGTSGLDPSCGYALQVDAFYEKICNDFCGSCGAF
jgi:Mg-chelatase subunit ChlD